MKPSSCALAIVLAQAATAGYVNAFVPAGKQFVSISADSQLSSWLDSNLMLSASSLTGSALLKRRGTVSLYSTPPAGSGGNSNRGFLGMDEDSDEDSDEEDSDDEEEDDLTLGSSRYAGAKSPFTGLKLDPFDPNPLIKPRPSRYFRDEPVIVEKPIPDEQLQQTMSEQERKENLQVMRQIRKNDLPDLRMRKDHAGWVEANNDLKRRYNKDPWFGVNERLRDAVLLGDDEEKIQYLKQLAARLGGPPPGLELEPSRGYAVHTEIYDIGISPTRAAGMLEQQIRTERAARGRAMMAERRKNQEAAQRQYEDDMRNPGVREDREAKERRERTMRRLMDEIEEDNKKKRERAKDILGKVPETPESRTKAMQKALQEARDEVKKMRRKQKRLGTGDSILDRDDEDDEEEDDDDDDDDDETSSAARARRPKSGADKAREAAAAEASGGRPRLPGDPDVTRGELSPSTVVSSGSTTVTGPLQVQVSSTYNKEQSDPPMRKHCFQYTIRITNLSNTDTIQLLGRRFEIQTVGSSMKDVVQGEGVTGRTPVLKPGEVFEYTSTAPLSVRPIGTTEIAARMRGEYRYVILQPGQETAVVEPGGSLPPADKQDVAALGTFHFIFPEDQRVKPIRTATTDDDEDDEDDDEEDSKSATKKAPATTAATAAKPAASASSVASAMPPAGVPPGTPASTLPGDVDMKTGDIACSLNESSDLVTNNVRVYVTSSYRPERSDDKLNKHCFAYNIRITNESTQPIQLVSRRFEIQTVGSPNKDVVQGPGVTGRQPILKPGEAFEYTSTAPLSVKPLLPKTPVVARMQGEYNFVPLASDGVTPLSSTPLQAKLASFHFILPQPV